MAFCVIKLTYDQRYKVGFVLSGCLATTILLGAFLLGFSIYVYISISPNTFSEKNELNFVFLVIGIFGINIMFLYSLGFKLCYRCFYQSYKKSTRHLLTLWCFAGIHITINLILICNSSIKIKKHIIKSMKTSMEKGMHNYLKELSWKQTIDNIQYQLQCCGVNNYLDWYETSWLDKYHIIESSDLIKQLRTSNDYMHLPVTPWSCCRLEFPMQCLHDPFQQLQSTHLWVDQPELVLDSINTSGCLDLLREPLDLAFSILTITVGILVFLNIVIILLWRILYTSCRNALLLENSKGVAPGWIFGRGDCGYSRGPTLSEMMLGESRRSRQQYEEGEVSSKTPNSPRKSAKSDEDPVSSSAEDDLLLK